MPSTFWSVGRCWRTRDGAMIGRTRRHQWRPDRDDPGHARRESPLRGTVLRPELVRLASGPQGPIRPTHDGEGVVALPDAHRLGAGARRDPPRGVGHLRTPWG